MMDRITDAMDDRFVSEKLAAAREYETKNEIAVSDRPLFHVTPAVGWMNDPNGFSVYAGRVHLFYQYHPYSTVWGPMHWGHQVTKDMIKWEQLPAALAPDTEYDEDGCFSGTAIEDKGRHILIYTSVMKNPDGEGVLQNQSIAVGDGTEYTKIGGNPVVNGDMLPYGLSREDFRDPKVWQEDGIYYMVAGTVDEDKKGQVVLFSSQDLVNWSFESVLAKNDKDYGGVWECPDFFEIDGHKVLLVSPIEMVAKGYEFHNGNNSIYFIGDYDDTEKKFEVGEPFSLDYGTDFYAPQTTLLPDGRRVMIAWMQSWHNLWIPQGQMWQGMMTLPREISLKDGRLIQRPVREIENYQSDKVILANELVSGSCVFDGIKGRFIDMEIVVNGDGYNEFVIDLAKNDRYYTRFTYDRRKNIIELDRTFAGFERDVVCIRRAEVKPSYSADSQRGSAEDVGSIDEQIKLRFILDRNSIELFVNDGIMTMSTAIYTPVTATGIEFSCDGKAVVDIEKYDIKMN